MDILTAILSVVTLVAIAAVAALALKGRNGGRNNEALREYIKGLNDSNQRNIDNLRQAHSTEMRLLTERHEKQVEALSKQWEERITQLDSTTRLAFKSLTQDSAAFLKGENADQMNTVLAPLRQRLVELTALIQRVQTDATSSRESLRERIDLLAEQNRTIGDEAKSLATALRGNSKVQGDWGETILQTILEKAGLQEGVNFRVQPGSDASGNAFRDSNGRLQRPDFIIDLPNGHRIIVDSKVSLTDYVEYCDAKDDNDRNKYGKRHVDSVKKHIKELGDKQYQKTVPGAMEHVLMFIPNEGAYLCACSLDQELWKYAADQRVVIVSPAHLLSTVHIIGQLWREERQDRNAAEIARIAGLLHDSFASLLGRMDRIGKAIDTTRAAYDETRIMLDDRNSQSLTRRVQKLKELGAKAQETIES